MLLNQGLLHAMHTESHTYKDTYIKSLRNEADKLYGPFIEQNKFIPRRLVVSLTACEIAENWPHQGQYNIAYKHISPFLPNVPCNLSVISTLMQNNFSSEHILQKKMTKNK